MDDELLEKNTLKFVARRRQEIIARIAGDLMSKVPVSTSDELVQVRNINAEVEDVVEIANMIYKKAGETECEGQGTLFDTEREG